MCGQWNVAELLTVGCLAFPQVHCISTEFTMRKHGGEKGVPFRVQIDTFKENENGEYTEHLHSASCQIKVFKVPRSVHGLSPLGNKLGAGPNSRCSPSERLGCRTMAELACKRASWSLWSCAASVSLVTLCRSSPDTVEATKPVQGEHGLCCLCLKPPTFSLESYQLGRSSKELWCLSKLLT